MEGLTMRSYLAIGLAVLILGIGAQTAMAQDGGQSASDRLLDILKERQIISEDEYAELRGLASKMEEENAELGQRLTELDRSVSDYLAKDGEDIRGNMTYNKGKGFRFFTHDGNFELNLGGFFLFTYTGWDMDRRAFDERYYYNIGGKESYTDDEYLYPRMDESKYRWSKDTNNFDVQELRVHFGGHAFWNTLKYFVELNLDSESSDGDSMYNGQSAYPYPQEALYTYSAPRSSGGADLLDAWVDYDWCGYTNFRLGQMRVPTGRQFLVHESDLAFPQRHVVSDLFHLRRDVGVMAHDMREFKMGDQTMAYDYMAGVFNGEGEGSSYNDSNRLAYAGRFTIYPMGYVDYTESDFNCSDLKMGFGGWYANHKPDNYEPAWSNERVTAGMYTYGLDGVMVFKGFYLTGEWMKRHLDVERKNMPSTGHYTSRNHGWYAQAGYMIPEYNLEVLGRYGQAKMVDQPYDLFFIDNPWINEIVEYAVGLAYYFDGHDFKVTLDLGRMLVDFKDDSDETNDYIRLAFWLNW
jgi:hypothetical protein